MSIKRRHPVKKYDSDDDEADLTMLYRKNNTIHFYCDIDRSSWIKFKKLLDGMNEDTSIDDITLRISSFGGRVSYAYSISSLIENNEKPIHGIVESECSSAALFLLLACKTRKSTRCSEFLIHEGRSDSEFSTSELIKTYKSEIILEKETKDYILARTKINSKQYDSINMDGITFYSSDAIKYGIISEII